MLGLARLIHLVEVCAPGGFHDADHGAQDAVVVEARDVVERCEQSLGEAYELGVAVAGQLRVELRLEEPHDVGGDHRVLGECLLDVLD